MYDRLVLRPGPANDWTHMNRSRRAWEDLAAASTIALVVSACSTSTSATSDNSLSGGGAGSSKSIITIGSEVPVTGQAFSLPQWKAGEVAAVAAVNASGGIDGHPLKLDVCDTEDNANLELTCMRKLISEKVSAGVGPDVTEAQSGREVPLAPEGRSPVVGSDGLTQAEYTTQSVVR